ncbi:uncharacterized protein [Anabrus simplex]|uniref:uncharacterized protein n=1 Tax=Anabrus simplex TaxID=316456 RepID=UPI0035A3A601
MEFAGNTMLLSLVFFAMGAQSWALSAQCVRSPSMKFSVSSWRNETGHRLVAADVRSHTSDKQSVSLSVELLSEKCGDNTAVILKTLSSTGQPEEQASVITTVAPTQSEEQASVITTVAPTQPEEQASVITTVAPTQPEEQASVITTVAPTQPEEQASVITTVAPTQPEEQASVITTVAPTVSPLPGYHHISGFGHYKKISSSMNWKDGVEACWKEGTRMLLVESQEELEAVYGWSRCCPWVGVYRENSSVPWINILGQQMNSTDYFGWLPNYPSRLGNCMLLSHNSLHYGTKNYVCQIQLSVVCEQML